jgi:hypothetical protein
MFGLRKCSRNLLCGPAAYFRLGYGGCGVKRGFCKSGTAPVGEKGEKVDEVKKDEKIDPEVERNRNVSYDVVYENSNLRKYQERIQSRTRRWTAVFCALFGGMMLMEWVIPSGIGLLAVYAMNNRIRSHPFFQNLAYRVRIGREDPSWLIINTATEEFVFTSDKVQLLANPKPAYHDLQKHLAEVAKEGRKKLDYDTLKAVREATTETYLECIKSEHFPTFAELLDFKPREKIWVVPIGDKTRPGLLCILAVAWAEGEVFDSEKFWSYFTKDLWKKEALFYSPDSKALEDKEVPKIN